MKKIKYLVFLLAMVLGVNNVSALTTDQVEQRLEEMHSTVFLSDYPVGSIYITTNTDENTAAKMEAKYGGKWQVYGTNRVLKGTTGAAGQTGGADSHTLSSNNLPEHDHSIPSLSGTAASASSEYSFEYSTNEETTSENNQGHTHNIPALSGTAASAGGHSHTISATAASAGKHSHGYVNGGDAICIDTGSSGTLAYAYGFTPKSKGGWYNNHNKNQVTISSGGAHTHTVSSLTAATSGAHTHTVSIAANTYATGAASATHTHAYTNKYLTGVSGVEAHTHDVTLSSSTTGKTGSASSFSTTDSYVTVYMFKRTE